MSIGLYIVLAPLYLKSVRKLQEKRFVFVKILAIIIPENGAKVSKIKCFQFAQQTLNKDIQKTDLPKKEKSNKDLSSTDSIPIHSLNPLPYDGEAATPPERKRKEATDAYSVYEEIIKDNIEYDHFVRYGQIDKDRLDEIVSIILETVCSKRKTIRIAGDDYPAELVKAKFMKLNSSHIEFVFDCMKENTTKIRNIKQYLKAVLFNAPNTIDSYYTALVNHDMYGGTIQSARKKGIPDYSYNEGESL